MAGHDDIPPIPARPDEALLKFRGQPNVILMPHTAIAARQNALNDLERLCMNLWKAM